MVEFTPGGNFYRFANLYRTLLQTFLLLIICTQVKDAPIYFTLITNIRKLVFFLQCDPN